ncbi:MAG: hypothetical protein F9K16_09000 [Thermoanaerobaculia bacterium]|nr:MAG: hypothetical protein F9K16_09000 [Thermoanaerobaculia bacterium]MBZ0102507.1 hypothetical protein [Thermoanaerobaculia bacterium]
MRRTQSWLAIAALLLTAVPAFAFVRPEASPLASREVRPAGFEADPELRLLAELEATEAAQRGADLAQLGLEPAYARLDARGGSWATLLLARPLIPGTGVGNDLTWDDLGFVAAPAGDGVGQAAWNEFTRFLGQHRRELGFDPAELVPSLGVTDGGALVQIHAGRQIRGVPVRGAALSATVNHGNLILLGAERWGKIGVSTVPTLSESDAAAALEAHLAPFEMAGWQAKPTLELLPLGVDGKPGHGWNHRLVWTMRPDLGTLNSFEAAVDAHSGEVLLFQDTNHYATRNIKGGVYPASYDGQAPDGVEVPGYPMPFATFTHSSGSGVTDSGGNLFNISGNITTQLQGPFVRIQDNCGAISESSGSGDLDLGVSPDPDCDTPPGSSSAGNTHSARTGFYELNRIAEMARGQSPSGPANTWLNAQLTSNMNINQTCNAFWNGSTVNFYREGNPCGNTGQLAGVFDHEWGHGLDDNGTNGSISAPGEGIADLYAAFRLNESCVGRGFFIDGSLCGGYGDPCTPASGCTGIRDIDWAHRTSGQPHTVAWVNANSNCGSVHCRGALYAESAWDLAKRDLPTFYGMDDNTAMALATRLVFKGADNVGTWFVLTNGTQGGCAATGGYLQFLGADDDNGNLADGTPHMQAIYAAFNRHEIACATPTVQDGGCASAPTQAPNVTVSGNDTAADLSWSAVPNAASYQIHRADGEFQCGFGKTLVGTTAGTFFQDTGLQNGREYSYIVTPVGSSPACMGPASSCDTVVPAAGLSASPSSVEICAGTSALYTVTVTPPFAPPVTMSLTGNPAPSNASFSLNPVTGPLPQNTVLTIGNTAGVSPGDYLMTANGNDGVTNFDLALQLRVFNAAPGAPALVAPANGATSVPLDVTFSWNPVAQDGDYELEVATDAAFTNIIRTATTSGTSTSVTPDLPSNVLLYWRVRSSNACGDGAYSAVYSFATVALPGDCGIGTVPSEVYFTDFEAGAPGWTSSGTGNTWAQSSVQAHSGTFSWRAQGPATVSDQRLLSPAIVLPASGDLSLQFWNYQEMEDSSGGCFDGAILEVSTDGGTSFTQVLDADLLTDPYNGLVSGSFQNPLGGLNAWCGDPQPFLNSVVDINAWAGQTVHFRFRFGSDSSVGRPNGAWFLDDVEVQVCAPDTMPFLDGFESGNTSQWSATQN